MSKVDGGKIAARPPNDILVVSYKLRIQIGIAFYELVYVLEELISLFVDALAIVMQALVCGNDRAAVHRGAVRSDCIGSTHGGRTIRQRLPARQE